MIGRTPARFDVTITEPPRYREPSTLPVFEPVADIFPGWDTAPETLQRLLGNLYTLPRLRNWQWEPDWVREVLYRGRAGREPNKVHPGSHFFHWLFFFRVPVEHSDALSLRIADAGELVYRLTEVGESMEFEPIDRVLVHRAEALLARNEHDHKRETGRDFRRTLGFFWGLLV